jgi:hypothetical protein
MRLRCLLRPPPISLGTPSAAGGRFGAPDGVRTLGAPFSERGRLLRFYSSKEEGVGNAETAARSGGNSNQQEHFLTPKEEGVGNAETAAGRRTSRSG